MLTSLLVRAQKELRNMVEKIYMTFRKYLNCHEQTGDRYVNFECTTGEGLDGKEEQVIRNQRKDGPCMQWQKA